MNYESVMETVTEFGTQWGLKVIGVLVALFAGWIVAGWVKRLILRSLTKRKIDATVSLFAGNLARYGIITAVVVGCLGVFGIQTASFAAVLGAVGLAVGLAFQGTLSNFSSGVMLIIFRPFKVDDLIQVGGELGIVVEIELFTTELKTLDNRRLMIPNSKVFGEVIENFTHHEIRRVDVSVGADYGADIDQTRKVLEKAAASIDDVLSDPPPQIFLKELGGSSVDWQVRVWCKTELYWDVYQATIRAAKMALDDASISIPFPQMDVHFDSGVFPAPKAQ